MSTLTEVKRVLAQSLELGTRIESFHQDSPLLGAIPELDSMAIVHLLTSLENHFGFTIEDDEISADSFTTLGALVAYVQQKIGAQASE